MSECKVYRREIEEAADGRPVSKGGRSHASACRACGDELRGRERLRALVGGLGKVEAPADFEFRLRARMASAKNDRGHGRFSGARWLYGFAPVAVAACFLIVSATLFFRQATRTTPTDVPGAAAPAPSAAPDRAASVNRQNHSARPAVEVKEAARVDAEVAAPPKVNKPVHRANARAVQTRQVSARGERRAGLEPGTLEVGVTSAQVIHLPLKTSTEPLRVILRDERGAEHVVMMRSVSFGSQDFLSRGEVTKPAVAAEVGGVW
jgi:hypothetical protein